MKTKDSSYISYRLTLTLLKNSLTTDDKLHAIITRNHSLNITKQIMENNYLAQWESNINANVLIPE